MWVFIESWQYVIFGVRSGGGTQEVVPGEGKGDDDDEEDDEKMLLAWRSMMMRASVGHFWRPIPREKSNAGK